MPQGHRPLGAVHAGVWSVAGCGFAATRRRRESRLGVRAFRRDDMLHDALRPGAARCSCAWSTSTTPSMTCWYRGRDPRRAGIPSPTVWRWALRPALCLDFFSGPTETAAPQFAALEELLLGGHRRFAVVVRLGLDAGIDRGACRRIAAEMTREFRRERAVVSAMPCSIRRSARRCWIPRWDRREQSGLRAHLRSQRRCAAAIAE